MSGPMSNGFESLLLNVAPGDRAGAVLAWFGGQPDARVAALALAGWLAEMASVAHRAPRSNASTVQIFFLEAEGMCRALDEVAEAAGDPEISAQLWAHASTSALVVGELADLPYAYAKRAILTGSDAGAVWEAFQSSLYGYSTGFFEDVEAWRREAAEGSLAPKVVTRAIAAARRVADDWSEEDREMLELVSE
jgi:hypothetical protein